MLTIHYLELIGYLCTLGLGVYIGMSPHLKAKWYALGLSLLFSVYGFIIHNLIIAFVNLAFAVIKLLHIKYIHKKKEYIRLFKVLNTNQYIPAFIEFHSKEINQIVPFYTYTSAEDNLSYILLRDMVPVGLFIAHPKDLETLMIDLDFVVPQYRDFQLANHIYMHNQQLFYDMGYRRFCIVCLSTEYEKYLKKMGFTEDHSTGERLFIRTIHKDVN